MASNVLTAEKRGVMQVARNMKDARLPIEQIAQMSGLSIAEIATTIQKNSIVTAIPILFRHCPNVCVYMLS